MPHNQGTGGILKVDNTTKVEMCSFSPLFAENVEGAQTDGITRNVGEKSGEKSCLTSYKQATPDIVGVDIEVDTSVNSPLRLSGGGHTYFEIHYKVFYNKIQLN